MLIYADPLCDTPVQHTQQGAVLVIGKGGTLGADLGSLIDLSAVPATGTLESVAEGLTAGTTQSQQGGVPITAMYSRFTTVANNGDAATLPASVPGVALTIINASASHSLQVFPNAGGTTTEKINALGANAAINVAATKVISFYCTLAGQWHTILSA